MEIIQKVWPGDNPFIHDRHQIMKAVKQELGPAGRDLNFNAYADNRSLFRYDMHTLPSEISELLDRHLDAVRRLERRDLCGAGRGSPGGGGGRRRPLSRRPRSEVLQKHGGLWFYDESYVISRRRD